MVKLTDEQKAFFQQMEYTFGTPGWAMMANRWREEADQIKESTFFNAETQIDLIKARERFDILEELIQLPDKIAQQLAALQDGEGGPSE